MIVVLPVSDADLPDVTQFMRQHLNSAIPQDAWTAAFRRAWLPDKPNNGFMLKDDGRIVGVLGAIYSEQLINGALRRFCNITSIVVLPEYRGRTLDLFARCLGQKSFNFTDLTPSAAVEKICRLLKFRPLVAGEYLCAHLPVPPVLMGVEVVGDERAASVLPAHAAKVYRDHGGIPWAERLTIGRNGAYCLVIYCRSRVQSRNGASILYFSDEALFRKYYWAIGGHLLLRKGLIGSRVSRRFFTTPPPLSISRSDTQTLLYKGEDLPDSQIASVYSELVALPL